MKHIAIVGGGMAGLTAAYTLLKTKKFRVSLYESNALLGGRVQSRIVNGQNVDFGGFLIYPWYKQGHKLFKELGVDALLTKTPLEDIYYVLRGASPTKQADIPFPPSDTFKLWGKSIGKILGSTSLAEPNLNRFGRKTIANYLRTALKRPEHAGMYESFFDTVEQGYCYGPVLENKMAFMAPMVQKTTLHGDVKTSFFFPNGIEHATNALAEHIQKMGGTIHVNTEITGVEQTTLKTSTQSFEHDAILFAQTVTDPLYQQILPTVRPEVWYTHFLTVAVSLSEMPQIAESQKWGAIFYESLDEIPNQTLSVVNLATLHGAALERCVLMNIILRNVSTDELAQETVHALAEAEIQRLYPNLRMENVLEYVHWKKTMPVAEESFVEAVRHTQGINNYYFAGDYLGAPSIETAITTGLLAANRIIRAE